MAFERVAKAVAPALEQGAEALFQRVAKAIKTPAIPQAAERGIESAFPATMEGAAVPIKASGSTAPYHGDPTLRGHIRATEAPEPVTIESWIQDMKTLFGSAFRRDPNLPKDVQQKLFEGAAKTSAAREGADGILRKVYEPLQTDPVNQVRHMHDHLITADELAQAGRDGRDMIRNQPVERWASHLKQLEEVTAQDPQIQEAMTRRQQSVDNMFQDMVARGWIEPERHLSDYTHVRKVHGILKGLAGETGQDLESKYLSAQQARSKVDKFSPRESDLLKLEAELLEEYGRKVAQHETFSSLMDDPSLNLTRMYNVGDVVGHQHAAYNPGPGYFGYSRKSPEASVINGMTQELGAVGNVVLPGSYVVPKDLAKTFMRFREKIDENPLTRVGRAMAKNLTVYNPANTRMNQVSDLFMAMHGMADEAAHPIGVLRMYPKALGAARKIAAGKDAKVMIGNQEVDVRALVESENIGGSTMMHEVQNRKISDELARLYPETERKKEFALFDALQKDRMGTELAPRIAAGLEAFERTGNISEFGRVGREITLTFGAGGPRASKIPMVRFLSPFLQFQGLASGRVVDMLKSPGSRNRALAGVMAAPVLTWMWNTRNPEFQMVEDALTPYEKDQSHIILPDPEDPTKPMRDTNGKPVVIRFRWWVPEEVMRMAGLGNFAARAHRVVRGRDTLGEAALDTGKFALKNVVETATMTPGLFSDITQTETYGGKKLDLDDRIMRVLPMTRPFVLGAERAKDEGLGAGAMKAGQELLGIKEANVMRTGEHLGDTDLIMARKAVKDAEKAYLRARLNEGASKAEDAKKDLQRAVEQLRNIAGVIRKEKSNGGE